MSRGESNTTIVAIASPPGGGLRGILRLSGPRSNEIVRAVWGASTPPDLAARTLLPGRFRDGRGEQPLLLLWMPGPRSFTREDVAEFHLPGSPPLLQAALERLLDLGAVPAAPGEFTRRAFLSGRIDLTRAEGVLALVTARNDGERRAGMLLLAGGLAHRVGAVRERFEGLRALVEASLDFDARDTGEVLAEEIELRAREARDGLGEAIGFETARDRGVGVPRIVLVGAPNAGKSTLFNRLAGKDSAIVAPVPGTTRDALVVELDLEGIPCHLIDTAGIEVNPPTSAVAAAAQETAQKSSASADLRLWVVDATNPGLSRLPPDGSGAVLVWNKTDLPGAPPEPPDDLAAGLEWIGTSAVSGAGIVALRKAAARGLGVGSEGRGDGGEGAGLVRELGWRHCRSLQNAASALARGLSAWRAGAPLELLAEELRTATEALDDIAGTTTPDDVLDRIFARFCLGK